MSKVKIWSAWSSLKRKDAYYFDYLSPEEREEVGMTSTESREWLEDAQRCTGCNRVINRHGTFVNDDCVMCDACLKWYTHCDECDNFFGEETTRMYVCNDGHCVCEDCKNRIDQSDILREMTEEDKKAQYPRRKAEHD